MHLRRVCDDALCKSTVTTLCKKPLVAVLTTATLFWPGSLMFIFSGSSLCRTRQPAWSPGLVITTILHRFLLSYTGFSTPANHLQDCGACVKVTVYTMQPFATWLTCVCRPTPCVVASNCVPRHLGLARTAIGQYSLTVSGPQTWNSLPAVYKYSDLLTTVQKSTVVLFPWQRRECGTVCQFPFKNVACR